MTDPDTQNATLWLGGSPVFDPAQSFALLPSPLWLEVICGLTNSGAEVEGGLPGSPPFGLSAGSPGASIVKMFYGGLPSKWSSPQVVDNHDRGITELSYRRSTA